MPILRRTVALVPALAWTVLLAAAPARSARADRLPLEPGPGAGSGAAAGAEAGLETVRPCWVHFVDKGLRTPEEERAAIRAAQAALTPRARARRARTRGGEVADLLDVPLHEPYVRRVLATGATARVRARWLNALSVDATPEQVRAIAALPFVATVRPVARARREPIAVEPVEIAPKLPGGPAGRALNYGACASQILPIQVDQLHSEGLSGAGLLVCVCDTGFLLTHDCFASLDVLAQWDFVNGDGVTENETGDDPSQHNHGTFVLSILAGFDPGRLIGPAYGATYLLAKTESLDFEMQVEEDYWTAAAQWADSLGADVMSTSLGYKDWYTYPDMDGDTALITIAADLAVANGISVINSAGNYGNQPWFYIAAPADGDSVIAVGAVDSTGVITDFSSHGPTFDGRTKPDVCAMGSGTLVALPWDPSGYGRGGGTSFSCPLVAGVAALLREARPLWGPIEVREALRTTATNAASPDNTYGWGIVQGADALAWTTSVAVGSRTIPGARFTVSPNPSADTSILRWVLPEGAAGPGTLTIHDVAGRKVRTLEIEPRPGEGGVVWDGRDTSGRRVPTGIYFARLETTAGRKTARVIRIR